MKVQIITILFIFVLLMFAYAIFKDSGMGKKFGNMKSKDKRTNPFHKKGVVMPNGPEIYYRVGEKVKDIKIIVTKPVFTIGRQERCDLSLNYDFIATKQAEIRREIEDGEVYYTFINYGKVTPAEYLNKKKKKYEWMSFKDEVELQEADSFYIGDVKLLIVTPKQKRVVTPTVKEKIGSKEKTNGSESSKIKANQSDSGRRSSDRAYSPDDFNL